MGVAAGVSRMTRGIWIWVDWGRGGRWGKVPKKEKKRKSKVNAGFCDRLIVCDHVHILYYLGFFLRGFGWWWWQGTRE